LIFAVLDVSSQLGLWLLHIVLNWKFFYINIFICILISHINLQVIQLCCITLGYIEYTQQQHKVYILFHSTELHTNSIWQKNSLHLRALRGISGTSIVSYNLMRFARRNWWTLTLRLINLIIIIIIIIIRQLIRRRNVSIKSLQGCRTAYATRN